MIPFIFLDYDGTLTPIVKKPEKAVLSAKARSLLAALGQKTGGRLAIVSGRSLEDVRQKVGVKGIYYFGNHGLELSGPGIRHKEFVAGVCRAMMAGISASLERRVSKIKGSFVENKGLTISLHYRLVKAGEVKMLVKGFFETIAPHIDAGKIKIGRGKKVYEVKPCVSWDKGDAVQWLLRRQRTRKKLLPVYIGDDVTDEDAFKALQGRGVTIRVGETGRPSYARYSLKNTRDVLKFLNYMENYYEQQK